MGSAHSSPGDNRVSHVWDEAQYREAVHAMESGNERAKTIVAYYMLTGLAGVDIDAKGAVALLEQREKKKDSEAMWILGLCCEYGIGTNQDIDRAVSLYNKSSKAKNIVGSFLLENDEGGRGTGVMKVWCL